MGLTESLLKTVALGAYLLTLVVGGYTLLLVTAAFQNPTSANALGAMAFAGFTLFCFVFAKALSHRGNGIVRYSGGDFGKLLGPR